MTPLTGTGQRYALELGQLWPGVQRALVRLDTIAGDAHALDEEELTWQLRRLQYQLHVGSEHIACLEPPAGAESAHAELADALACARDATAEVAEAIAEEGHDGLRPLLHEWRGALFRVRLARLRLAAPAPRVHVAVDVEPAEIGRPLLAFVLALGGAIAFAGGATLGSWPAWALGLVAVVAAMLAYRP